MIDRNHPAVEAAARSAYERTWRCKCEHWRELDDLERAEWRAHEAAALNAALPHLTTATEENLALFRDTPVGRALKAEGWRESLDAGKNGSFSYQVGPIPPGTLTSRELAETEDD